MKALRAATSLAMTFLVVAACNGTAGAPRSDASGQEVGLADVPTEDTAVDLPLAPPDYPEEGALPAGDAAPEAPASEGPRWVKESSMVTGAAIHGTGPNDVWVVGRAGEIWHSDGNGTWTSRTAEYGWRLTGVWGSGPSDVYVSVRANFIFHWNGAGWEKQTKGIAIGLTFETIWGSGPTDIYTADPSIYHSMGDGQWQGAGVPFQAGPYVSIWGSGPNDVWALGSDGVTRWNGRAWKHEPTGQVIGVTAIWGSGPTDVYALYSNNVRHTDGSGSWVVQPPPLFKSDLEGMTSIWGSGPNDIYVGGSEGRIFHSRGDGFWSPQVVDPKAPLTSIDGIWGTSAESIYVLTAAGIYRAQSLGSPDGGP